MSSQARLAALLAALCSLAFVIVSIGCGGGGGSGSAALLYRTDWTNRFGNPGGLSQRVRVFDAQGREQASLIVNQDTQGLMEVRVNLPRGGTHRLLVELFSLRDLAGTKTGEIETLIEVNGSTIFLSAVGETPTSIAVTPPSASFSVQQGKQFYATGYSQAARAAFITPGSITWSTLGGVATINQSGFAQGTSEGQGSVRATHNPTGLQGGASITVTGVNTTTGKWTILVYLNAANDLQFWARSNVNAMERVAGNPDVRFVLQWKEAVLPDSPNPNFVGTRRYLVKPDGTNTIVSELIQDMGTNVDMGAPSTLSDFINWGKTFYPAERYVLVVWNHGNGWRRGPADWNYPTRAVSYDDQTGNAIQTWQLSQAIGNHVLDILAWDASLMQMMEVAYEVKDRALYIAGSEESPPAEGYPYDLIFDDFRDNPDAPTKTLSQAFVTGMLKFPWVGRRITQSVVDTGRLADLAAAVNSFAAELIANKDSIASEIQTIRSQAQSYSNQTSPYPRIYRDLYDVANRVEAMIDIPALDAAAQAVKLALRDGPNPAIVWEGHNSASPGSRGLSIDFSSAAQFAQANSAIDYALLRFAQDTLWNEWLSVAP